MIQWSDWGRKGVEGRFQTWVVLLGTPLHDQGS